MRPVVHVETKRDYLKGKLSEIETKSKNKNIRDLYTGIKEFKKGYQARVNVIKNENEELLADSNTILKTITKCAGLKPGGRGVTPH